jgi:hypothetical protein
MKTVFNTKQLCHIWASRTHEFGSNPSKSLYFKGDTIYSYGEHYVAACIHDHDVVLINSHKYSNTTAKQLFMIQNAVTQYKKWTVPDVLKPENNHQYFINKIADVMSGILSGRKDVMSMDIMNEIHNYRLYCLKFNLKMDDEIDSLLEPHNELIHDLQIIGQETALKFKERDQAKILKHDAKNKEIINRTHSNFHLWTSNIDNDFKPTTQDIQLLAEYSGHDYCRVHGNKVVTQRGAEVPLVNARQFVAQGLKAGFESLVNQRIGNFRIDEYSDGILTIGCHKINVKQVREVLK